MTLEGGSRGADGNGGNDDADPPQGDDSPTPETRGRKYWLNDANALLFFLAAWKLPADPTHTPGVPLWRIAKIFNGERYGSKGGGAGHSHGTLRTNILQLLHPVLSSRELAKITLKEREVEIRNALLRESRALWDKEYRLGLRPPRETSFELALEQAGELIRSKYPEGARRRGGRPSGGTGPPSPVERPEVLGEPKSNSWLANEDALLLFILCARNECDLSYIAEVLDACKYVTVSGKKLTGASLAYTVSRSTRDGSQVAFLEWLEKRIATVRGERYTPDEIEEALARVSKRREVRERIKLLNLGGVGGGKWELASDEKINKWVETISTALFTENMRDAHELIVGIPFVSISEYFRIFPESGKPQTGVVSVIPPGISKEKVRRITVQPIVRAPNPKNRGMLVTMETRAKLLNRLKGEILSLSTFKAEESQFAWMLSKNQPGAPERWKIELRDPAREWNKMPQLLVAEYPRAEGEKRKR